MKPFIFMSLLFLLGVSSCDSRGGSSSTISRATGGAYEVIVVMDNDVWESNCGNALREELTSPVPYLPQAESSMRYTYVRPDLFSGMFKSVRNILIVNIDNAIYTKASLLNEPDKWARGQSVVYLNAPDKLSAETFLLENQRAIVNFFTKEEMKRTADFLRETYSSTVLNQVKDMFGITLYAPSDINSCEVGDNCLWFTNDASTGRMDLLVYSFPYTDKNTFTLDYLVGKRDSITKLIIRTGDAFPDAYMSTEKRVVDYQASSLNGKYCGIVRGLWRMEGGDMMGGPFVSYARVDEPNRRVIVTEGFVYEPEKAKRNYIRRLEAALHTTRFQDENE